MTPIARRIGLILKHVVPRVTKWLGPRMTMANDIVVGKRHYSTFMAEVESRKPGGKCGRHCMLILNTLNVYIELTFM